MYSFEANIICDACKDQVVTGEPGTVAHAVKTAKQEAARAGWTRNGLRWRCQLCHERNQSDGKKVGVLK